MKLLRLALSCFLVLICSRCNGQGVSDVEMNPNGSYNGGQFDSVDLLTGNVFLNIPLVSFPQLGKLPPLSFSVALNNAPYTQSDEGCDPDGECDFYTSRYDVSPPGSLNPAQGTLIPNYSGTVSPSDGYYMEFTSSNPSFQNMGAYLTSSYGGGIVTGQEAYTPVNNTYTREFDYNVIDPSGITHELESDANAVDTLRAPDGSGYTFLPDLDENNTHVYYLGDLTYWLHDPNATGSFTGLRTGTLIAPSGVKYKTTLFSDSYLPAEPNWAQFHPHLATTTVSDPMNNTVTRGPWYWSGYEAAITPSAIQQYYANDPYYANNPSHGPVFTDSVGRVIPDVLTLQSEISSATNTGISWNVPGPSGGTLPYSIGYGILRNGVDMTTPTSGNDWDGNFNPPDPSTEVNTFGYAIQYITLPNGSQWRFNYGPGADLQSVITPTGGTISYKYTTMTNSATYGMTRCGAVCHAISERDVDDGQGNVATTYYTYGQDTNNICPLNPTTLTSYGFTTTVTDPMGNDTVHTFCPFTVDGNPGTFFSRAYTEYETDYYDSSSNLLRYSISDYGDDGQTEWDIPAGPAVDVTGFVHVYFRGITTYEPETNGPGNVTANLYDYDDALFTATRIVCSGAVGSASETCAPKQAYDPNGHAIGSPGISYRVPTGQTVEDNSGVLRETVTQPKFQTTPSFLSSNILDAPDTVTVYDGSGNQAAKTVYGYDGNANVNSVSKWLNTTGTNVIVATMQYDSHGSPTLVTDANSNSTSTSGFMDQCASSGHPSTYTQTVLAAYQTSIQESSTGVYDCNTGALVSSTDPNGVQTQYIYSNTDGRLNQVKSAVGTTSESWTAYSYPSMTEIDTAQDQVTKGDGAIQTKTVFDGLGRTIHQTDAANKTVDTTYTLGGQVATVTNPHGTSSAPTDGVTQYFYDPFGRPVKQIDQDGGIKWNCYNYQDANYPQPNCIGFGSGSGIATRDEVGHDHAQLSNALGQLEKVWEPDPQTGAFAMQTYYSYDALGNLTNITQSGKSGDTPRVRSFTYDSLSRLLNSTNPETGTTAYGYLTNSALCAGDLTLPCSKTDARGVTTSYTYDALNRLTLEQAPAVNGAPAISNCLFYDYFSQIPQSQYAVGRLVEASNCTNADEAFSYDPLGRVTWQTNWRPSSPNHTGIIVTAAYDLAGNLTDLTYPDGRHIAQTWNAARLSQVNYADWNGQAVNYPYLSSITYAPTGAPTSMSFGNGVTQSYAYNSRSQPVEISAALGSSKYLDKQYCYGPTNDPAAPFCTIAGGPNNGNILQILDPLNNANSQGFSYDKLDRLASFSNGSGSMQQSYSIDSFGNLNQSGGTLQSNLSFDANNRISGGGYSYDAAGNVTAYNNGAFTSTYAYDAEERLYNVNNGAAIYTYDAAGARVRKDFPGDWTEYVYFNGAPIAEKNANGTWSDYIFANGQRIASAPTAENVIHVWGTGTASDYVSYTTAVPSLANYVFQAGDTLHIREMQSGSLDGGVILFTGDGRSIAGVPDQDGLAVDDDTTRGVWHNRVVPLDNLTGSTYSTIWFGGGSGALAQSGAYDVWFAEMAVLSADGTVHTILNGAPGGIGWVNQQNMQSTQAAGASLAADTSATHYYAADHLGSARIELSSGGWPLASDTYYPFGQEPAPPDSPNHYKFTGYERDAESGLDYASARHYNSGMGRFMSPDPSGLGYADQTNPQSFNLYTYVMNNPLSNTDPTGMTCQTNPDDGSTYDDEDGKGCSTIDNADATDLKNGNYSDTVYAMQFMNQAWSLIGNGSGPISNGDGYSGPAASGVAPSNGVNTKHLACAADAAINFGLGFIPGYNAAKLIGQAAGLNFNFVQNGLSGKSIITAGPTPFSAAAALGSAYSLIKTMNFNDAGGAQAFTRLNSLTGGSWNNARTAINELEGAASTAGTVANLLNTASAAYDIYQCYQTK